MLENLIKLVKENAGEAIINNPAIPNQKNDAAVKTVAQTILKSIKKGAGTGGLDVVKDFLSGADKPETQNISQGAIGDVANTLIKKFGLSKDQASGISGNLVPEILKKLVTKTNDPNDSSFDLGSVIKMISAGGGIGGILAKLKKLF